MGNLGSILWKLCQLGLVLLLVGLAVVSVMRPDGEAGEDMNRKGAGTQVKNRGSSALAKSHKEFAEGHIDLAKLLDLQGVNREVGFLAEGTTQVQQMVFWEIVEDEVLYRIVLTPYDRPAHELMMDATEAIFMSFHSADDQRVVPVSAPDRISTRKLRVATKDGYAAGWFHDGLVPLDGKDPGLVEHSKVGWIFSGTLHARLKKIQAPKGAGGKPVTDPHGSKTGASGS